MSKPEVVEIHVETMYKHSLPKGFLDRLRQFVMSELGSNGHLKEMSNRPMEPAKNLYFLHTTRWVKLEEPKPVEKTETLTAKAERIAGVLRKKLGPQEWNDLRNLLGDYDTDKWLCQALSRVEKET